MAELLLITPARDEAVHLERTIRAVAAQTHRPDLWLIVDDGSTDATAEILDRAAGELPFLRVLQAPEHPGGGPDRLAVAAEARAFNWALETLNLDDYTHIGKLDADIELPAEYFQRLLDRFEREPRLGIAGGSLLERGRGGWQLTKVPDNHVRGALKLYSRECFAAIGGIEERLGWDTIDETYARMHGFDTRSLTAPGLTARHHRPVATRGGALRGRARHGQCAYILRYGGWWVTLRSFKVACAPPYGLTGAAFLYGYMRSAARGESRVEDEQFRRFVAAELRDRVKPSRLRRTRTIEAEATAKVPAFFTRS
ncbi:MAG TPA: glycosyltransferase family A protein [Solirubrobacterales bacterium]|nr:glycosyltransferase family A protein [Solirubrobacterales bacterium]